MLQNNTNALIIVDVQNDFCEGGSLEVQNADQIVPIINKLSPQFDKVVATQDWHPAEHRSFASNHDDKQPFDNITLGEQDQTLWPDHCVQGSEGAQFHPDLDLEPVNLIIRKGTNVNIDSYSAFRENDRKTITGLYGYLDRLDVQHVFITGLATDVCVMFTALDASQLGLDTFLIEDATKGIDQPEGSLEKSMQKMKENHVKMLHSSDIL